VDINPQPNYPYRFTPNDAVSVLRSEFPDMYDAIHASPPCQLFTRAKHLRDAQGSKAKETVDLLTPTLEILRTQWNHLPWVVENVEAAKPLMQPRAGEYLARLCGSSFGLGVQRHRLFLSNVPLRSSVCDHSRFELDPITGKPRPWGVFHVPGDNIPKGGRTARDAEHGRQVMGVHRLLPWATLKEGFPPAYTAHVGADLLLALSRQGVAA
jgi:DNA (cytosine-5)-methyltransferase 1